MPSPLSSTNSPRTNSPKSRSNKHLGNLPRVGHEALPVTLRRFRVAQRIYIQDYEFSILHATIPVGETVEFALSDDVPFHAEHQLESKSIEASLRFETPLLNRSEQQAFRFCCTTVGEFTVRCKIYQDMSPCTVIVVSPEDRPNSRAAMSATCPIDIARTPIVDPNRSPPRPALCPTKRDIFSHSSPASSSITSTTEAQNPKSFTHAIATVGLGGGVVALPSGSYAQGYTSESSFYDSDDIISGGECDSPPRPLAHAQSRDGGTHDIDSSSSDACHTIFIERLSMDKSSAAVALGTRVQFRSSVDTNEHKLIVTPVEWGDYGYDEMTEHSSPIAPLVQEQWVIWSWKFDTVGTFLVKDEVFSFIKCLITVESPLSPNTIPRLNDGENGTSLLRPKEEHASLSPPSQAPSRSTLVSTGVLHLSADDLDAIRAIPAGCGTGYSPLGPYTMNALEAQAAQSEEKETSEQTIGRQHKKNKKNRLKKQQQKKEEGEKGDVSDRVDADVEETVAVDGTIIQAPKISPLVREKKVDSILSSPVHRQKYMEGAADCSFDLDDEDESSSLPPPYDEAVRADTGNGPNQLTDDDTVPSRTEPDACCDDEPPPYNAADLQFAPSVLAVELAPPIGIARETSSSSKASAPFHTIPPSGTAAIQNCSQLEDVWGCSRCTFLNAQQCQMCAMCEEPRPLQDSDFKGGREKRDKKREAAGADALRLKKEQEEKKKNEELDRPKVAPKAEDRRMKDNTTSTPSKPALPATPVTTIPAPHTINLAAPPPARASTLTPPKEKKRPPKSAATAATGPISKPVPINDTAAPEPVYMPEPPPICVPASLSEPRPLSEPDASSWASAPGMESVDLQIQQLESFFEQRWATICDLIAGSEMDTLPGGTRVPIVVGCPLSNAASQNAIALNKSTRSIVTGTPSAGRRKKKRNSRTGSAPDS